MQEGRGRGALKAAALAKAHATQPLLARALAQVIAFLRNKLLLTEPMRHVCVAAHELPWARVFVASSLLITTTLLKPEAVLVKPIIAGTCLGMFLRADLRHTTATLSVSQAWP